MGATEATPYGSQKCGKEYVEPPVKGIYSNIKQY